MLPPFSCPGRPSCLARGPSILSLVDFTNVYSLIGEAQIFATGSALDLLDVKKLAASTQKVFMSYTGQVLSYTLPTVQQLGSENVTVPATLTLYYSGIKQDLKITISLKILLSTVLAAIGFLLFAMPRKTMLPKPLSSIAAQISFLARSNLVRRLREEGATKTKDTKI